MENQGIIVLTRQQLYDEVWNQPVAKVAKKYNLNYSRLLVSLKQAGIPYPYSGYWTRVDFGKDISGEVIPLSGDVQEEVRLLPQDTAASRKRKKSDLQYNFRNPKERDKIIDVFRSLKSEKDSVLHKMLRGRETSLREWICNVSEGGFHRAVLIADALFKTIEKLDGEILPDLSLKIHQDIAHIKFTEAQDKIPHEMLEEEVRKLSDYNIAKLYGRNVSKPRIRKYDRIYNGKLCVIFDDRSHIKDNEEFKLEDRIDDIVIRLYEISENRRAEQEQKEVQQRLYLETAQREEEQRKRKQLEMERTLMLHGISKDYRIACDIRNYISAIMHKDKLTTADLEWIEWAKKKADWYDPIVAREDEFLGKRDHMHPTEEKYLEKITDPKYNLL